MIHLGDITKISGYTAPMVDCIIGGSPCQDLSVAGKRAGLDGERSGLYMEQIRIVKEMRERDERNGRTGVNVRPRYMVWENVPGAFSSNKGEDFRIVLEELAKIADKDAVIPMPDKSKWTTCGCIVGDGWSIAWRVLDAQFWGVAQRRRRIALVADFGGQSATEILLVRKSVSGHSNESQPQGKEVASDASRGVGTDDCIGFYGYNGEVTGSRTSTLGVNCGMSTGRNGVVTLEPGIAGREGGHIYENVCGTLRGKNAQFDFEVSDKGVNSPVTAYGFDPSATRDVGQYFLEEKGNVLTNGTCPGHHNGVVVAVDCRNGTEDAVNGALQSNAAHSLNGNNVVRTRYIVRRLTPLECERLQGYPDGWTDIGEWKDSNGKKRQTSNAARYKALGNSIALPPWKWVLKRLCACYEMDATMASLFDGIGGFPYLWEQLNGKGS